MATSRQIAQRPGHSRIALLLTACAIVLPLAWSDASQAVDCNSNGVEDATDIAAGTSDDCNTNGVPDECDVLVGANDDCNLNIVPDDCELAAGSASDCNTNGVLDECDVNSFAEIVKLTASDAAGGAQFGFSVSIDGNTAVVGAESIRSAYVFRKVALDWQEIAKLTVSDTAVGSGFGWSVSISGDTVVIGAPLDADGGAGSGAAYVFREVVGVWQEIAKLTASDAAADDSFGFSVSISGNTAVIGTFGNDDGGIDSGSAYVFREVAGVWQEVAKLTASDAATDDRFGSSVSISGDTAVIGAGSDDDGGTDSGSAYVFREVAGVWQEIAKLTASDASANDNFGVSISLSGDTAVVGAYTGNALRGSAYVFREVAGVWQQSAKLTAADGATFDLFGLSVSLSGNTAVIGASRNDDAEADSGSAYVFREVAGVWQEVSKLTASDTAAGDWFGVSVAISGGTAVIGANLDDDGGLDSGSVYLFDSPLDANDNGVPDECDPDCNSNGVPDDLDILSGASTDCNANGVPDECDLLGGTSEDCNLNIVPDECELAAGSANDCNINGILDECDVVAGTSDDCNLNIVPDDCELAAGSASDCNTNGVLDECDDTSFGQIAKLTAADTAELGAFGRSVSISGNIAFIGAPGDDDEGLDSGSVYVYRGEAGAWQEVARLLASDGAAGDGFGGSVSICGSTAIVGASGNDDGGASSGSAYVFREMAGVWQEIAKLTALDSATGDRFGGSVSICGSTAIVGATGNDDGGESSGSAYVFREVAGVWQEIAKLTASDAAANDSFGGRVSISGNTAVIGARFNDDAGTSSGSAYVFREIAGVWQEIAKLNASDAAAFDYFGIHVSISGDTVAIAATGYVGADNDTGSVYLFREVIGVWQEIAKLVATDSGTQNLFGIDVSISGNTVLVGVILDNDGVDLSGSAYVFREVAGVWQEFAKLSASDAMDYDAFGEGVSLSGNMAVIGAPGLTEFSIGSAYVFDSSFDANSNGTADLCEPDCNTNGVPDELDLIGGASIDCNTNGVPDECDLLGGTSDDCNLNNVSDDCERDCNANGVPDECDVIGGTSDDCDLNIVPDECELAAGSASDCNSNGVLDGCDVNSLTQIAKLTASDAATGDGFGQGVSISGNTVVIGAPFDDRLTAQASGSAYVFREMAGVWQQMAKLIASDGATGDNFGVAISIGGNTAIIGATGDDVGGESSGSAYVFREVAGVWQQIAKLAASDAGQGDVFGQSVSISENTGVIGARRDDDGGADSGSAYVFGEVAGVWQEIAKLTASDAAAGDGFGVSVSISGETAVIGAFRDDDGSTDSGSAYVFRVVAGVWQEAAKLTASDPAAEDLFGISVSISGNTAVIGAVGRGGSGYVFREEAGVWQQIAKLAASDGNSGDEFGVSVSISGNTGVIGARRDDDGGADSGSAYVFGEVAGVWQEIAMLTASDAAAGDFFGESVSISGDTAVIGASLDDDGGTGSGSAYVFEFLGAGVDCNANGLPDECELIAAFDYNVDGAIDLADYAGFAECLAGPDASPVPAVSECAWICLDAFDSDLDGDVDLADIAAFQVQFEGSQP